jgi:4a-hydroxytetrahydrobiopterin dehydratase
MSAPSERSALAARKCKPCEGGVAPLGRDEARKLLGVLADGWQLAEDGRAIHRSFAFRDFYRTMSFTNALAHIANIEDHHPDLEVGYNYCRVRFTTHAIKGLSENDFICAAKIDGIAL